MLRQVYLAALLGLGFCGICAGSAGAQQSDPPDSFYEYARNKIGILRYCRDQAFLGQVTADRAIKAIESALARYDIGDGPAKERGDSAEKFGERGFWEADGKRDLVSVADDFRTTAATVCKELAGQPPVTRQVEPRVATSPQAPLSAVRPTASIIEPAATPTASTDSVVPATATLSLFNVNKWLSPLEVNKWRLDQRERPWARGTRADRAARPTGQ